MKAALLALGVGCLLGMGLLGHPQPPHLSSDEMLWLGAAALLELAAPALPRFGFVSPAVPLWLGLAAARPALAWPVLLAAGVAALLRGCRARQAAAIPLEWLADWQPLCLALGVAHALRLPLAAPALWLFLWWTQPSWITSAVPGEPEIGSDWAGYRARLLGVALGLAALSLAAPVTRTSLPAVAVAGYALAGVSGLLVRGVQAHAVGLQQRRKQRGLQARERGLEQLREGLQQTSQEQKRTGAELEVRLETYDLVDNLLQSLGERDSLQHVAQQTVQRLERRFQAQNAALFWRVGDDLLPVAANTNLADRLAAAQLTGAREPVVDAALASGRLEAGFSPAGSLFSEDAWSVAAPFREGRGALYLGYAARRNLNEDETHFLDVLARHSILALESAASYSTLEDALGREAETATRNEALVQRLALMIDGVTQLIRLRDPQAMLEAAERVLGELIPHSAFYAFTAPPRQADAGLLNFPLLHSGAPTTELRALATRVRDQALPLLLNAPPRLAVPLVSERGCLGGLVLERAEPEFSREDQDILSVLTYQLGSALISAQLYSELQKTHAALRDSQAQLVQSSKMAAVGQLAGGVAHELNTPLGAIALAVEAAQMNLQNKPERAQQRLERATRAVGQMKEIVSKLLFYSRDARSGQRETDLNEVIEDTLQLVGHQLQLDNVQVQQELGPAVRLTGNPNELQQVFTNLILNARDAMTSPGAAGRTLRLSTGSSAEGVWARVDDQGCGMPPEVAERIFEPFYTTKEVGKGTGLGLSVTSQLVKSHGGTIAVESQPGRGTRFTLQLPLKPPEN